MRIGAPAHLKVGVHLVPNGDEVNVQPVGVAHPRNPAAHLGEWGTRGRQERRGLSRSRITGAKATPVPIRVGIRTTLPHH